MGAKRAGVALLAVTTTKRATLVTMSIYFIPKKHGKHGNN